MPAQDCARGDQATAKQDRRQPPDEGGEDRPAAQSRRGVGLVRRSTATSWRNTSSSTFLDDDRRPIIRIRPSTCRKIRYSSRSDTMAIMPDRRGSPITAGQQGWPSFGTPQAASINSGVSRCTRR